MKKAFLMLVASAVAVLMLSGMTACKEVAKSVNGTSSDSDSVAQELPRTLDNALKPEGNVTTWLVAGFLEDGGYKMFIVDGDESRFVQDNIGDTDTIYVLRLVSYKQTKEENEALEDGGTFKEIEGDMVVDAYDPATKAFVVNMTSRANSCIVGRHTRVLSRKLTARRRSSLTTAIDGGDGTDDPHRHSCIGMEDCCW